MKIILESKGAEMEIKTKFDIGDKVWVAEYYGENNKQYYKPLKIRITNIVIGVDCLGTDIQYRSVDTPFTYFEEEMFNSKKRAQKECNDKLNDLRRRIDELKKRK